MIIHSKTVELNRDLSAGIGKTDGYAVLPAVIAAIVPDSSAFLEMRTILE
jgi:hypothetical protein